MNQAEYELECKACGCAFIGENKAGISEDALWLCPGCGRETQMKQLGYKPEGTTLWQDIEKLKEDGHLSW